MPCITRWNNFSTIRHEFTSILPHFKRLIHRCVIVSIIHALAQSLLKINVTSEFTWSLALRKTKKKVFFFFSLYEIVYSTLMWIIAWIFRSNNKVSDSKIHWPNFRGTIENLLSLKIEKLNALAMFLFSFVLHQIIYEEYWNKVFGLKLHLK